MSVQVFLVSLCIAAMLPIVKSSGCSPDTSVCEFWLSISHRLTMMAGRTAVFPAGGKLYSYDVTNTSAAEPVDPSDVITTDGWETQGLAIVVNGTFPGPTIQVYENQTVVVHVTNRLTSAAVTLHWHGMHQVDTPWMDGVAHVTQCPIQPHASFTYAFKAWPRGTFWYHSHIGAQTSMGVLGALLVKGRDDVMAEHLVVIQEWSHRNNADLVHVRTNWGFYHAREPVTETGSLEGGWFGIFPFDAALINGRGRHYFSNGTHNGAPLTRFDVEPGQTYRFRVIGAAGLYPFRVSVDGHELTLVASDGFDISPVAMESVIVNPGERFDFLLTANQSAASYWLRAETLEVGVVNHRADAILYYVTAGEEEPRSQRKVCREGDRCLVVNCPFLYYPADHFTDCLDIGDLRSLHDPHTPGVTPDPVTSDPVTSNSVNSDPVSSDVEEEEIEDIFLNFGFIYSDYPSTVNARSFKHHSVSPLTQPQELDVKPCDPDCGKGDKVCWCPYTITLEHNKVYNFIFMNMGVGRGWNHPIHMHGHSFHVIKTGYPPYNKTTGKMFGPQNSDINCRGNPDPDLSLCSDATWANSSWGGNNIPGAELSRPPVKDTIHCPAGGYVVVRIRADNPGLWLLHCHVETHHIDGMALLLNESFSRQPLAPRGFPRCGSFQMDRDELVTSLSSPRYAGNDDASSPDDEVYDKELFWSVVGVLLAIVALQLLMLVLFCIRLKV